MQRGVWTRVLAGSVWVVVVLLPTLIPTGALFAGESFGGDRQLELKIAPAPLRDALAQLADLTGLQILYDPPLVQGLVSRELKGRMSPRQALEKLLAATDISFEFTADDAVALHPKSKSMPRQQRRDTSPARPQTVTISAQRSLGDRYNDTTSVTAVGVDADVLTTPFASSSLTQQVLRDQQTGRLDDALEFVSGVETAPNGQSAAGFSIRGFTTYQYYVDGVRVTPDLNHDGFRDLANVESIEVVKGPLSTLYGRTEPGGLINVITKQPLADPYLSVQQQIGDFARYRTEFDAGGPLSVQDGLLYRFNAAYESGESYRGFNPNRRIFLAPVVSWKISEKTDSTFYLEFLDSHDDNDSGLPVIGGRIPPVSVNETIEDGGEVHTRDLRMGIRGSHVFDDGWTERHYVDARRVSAPQSPQWTLADDGLSATDCSPGGCPVARKLLAIPVDDGTVYSGALNLTHNWSLWRSHHSFLVGLDVLRSTADIRAQFAAAPVSYIDLFHPQHSAVPPNPQYGTTFDQSPTEQWGGIFFQDQVSLGERLLLLGGAREDVVGQWKGHQNALTGRGGIVWRLTDSLSAYLNFSEGFGVSSGLYTLGPTSYSTAGASSRAWETGVKAEFLDGRLGGSLDWFDLVKHDMGSPSQLPVLGYPLVAVASRNEGLELDLHGEVLPGVSLLASGAFIESRIIGANENYYVSLDGTYSSTAGIEVVGASDKRLSGVPRFGGSLWATYAPPFAGVKLGLGAVARTERMGDNANDYQLPGFVRWNALAAYSWPVGETRFSLQLNIENLFNARYFESVSSTYVVMPGAPRRWSGVIRAEF